MEYRVIVCSYFAAAEY